MTDRCPGVRRPWLLLLGAAAVLGVLAWLWWSATQDGEVGFLPCRSPAQWIVYPSAPDLVFHPRAEMSTVFRRSFVLGQAPRKAELLVAGFHRYELWLNGVPSGPPLRRGRSWKQPNCYEVS